MIISFFPGFEGDENFFQFEPITPEIFEKLRNAKAVIFPPTVSPELYYSVKNMGIPVFPEYDLRFRYPGKLGQHLLLSTLKLPRPFSILIPRLCGIEENPYARKLEIFYPFVLKGNYGDEGTEVFLVRSPEEFREKLKLVKSWERSGRFGFIIQEYIDTPFDARAIVIGKKVFVFFREGGFKKNIVREGNPIPCPKKGLKKRVKDLVDKFVELTGFNLVAIDILFKKDRPLINEFNFVFGRRLIGEKKYEQYLKKAIKEFLSNI